MSDVQGALVQGPQQQGVIPTNRTRRRGIGRGTRTRTRIHSTGLAPHQLPALLARLEALMPYSIPLLRRIQFHLHEEPASESARVFVAVADATDGDSADGDGDGDGDSWRGKGIRDGNGDDDDAEFVDRWLRAKKSGERVETKGRADAAGGETGEAVTRPQPWVAAHIDLANAGQSQVWTFASWEADEDDGLYPLPSSSSAAAPASTSALQSPPSPSPSPPDSLPHGSPLPSDSSTPTPTATTVHHALMHSLFEYIHTTLIPRLPTSPPPSWLELQRTGKYLTTPYSRDKVLFATVCEKLWGYFPPEARARTDDGYWKYLFRVAQQEEEEEEQTGRVSTWSALPAPVPPSSSTSASASPSEPTPPLPPTYRFGPMQPSHLQAVLDRTPIPRTLATLRQYVSLGVFYRDQPDPIGWGFLGKDASLSSLHTEPEHRGRGLAVALGRELLKRQHVVSPFAAAAEVAAQDEAATAKTPSTATPVSPAGSYTWAHADVSQSNTASRRVMEKLGGTPRWMVMWTEVDIERVVSLSSRT
ncbi:hypothetical protein AYO20_04036 [Fonsecaea nubica]|uniref:N-acetyltransferase domain-containing protein n=1 Tax=Fonsecaea nubica TaxID=856822 RepID=A0A178D5S6_9EURO|nr:hypothetical protein AYO20_04036 [Fonsecaea nubica]OAL36704.1 hypothetical protein AYO20_04036 [Fonsecaea nubica]